MAGKWKMTELPAKILVIFDYSGTLSIEAPAFGCPDRLVRAFAESGLAEFGVTDADIFWEKIVFPTWDEGSRTKIGYARIIADRIASLHLSPGVCRSEQSAASCPKGRISFSPIFEAAERFMTMYLGHSRIDPLWRPLLEELSADQNIAVVIATDHYAEATGAIVRYLKDWGIAARSGEGVSAAKTVAKRKIAAAVTVREALAEDTAFPPSSERYQKAGFNFVIVANSAEVGFWKADRRFWEQLRLRLPERFRAVVIVDDFGFNEADANGYGRPALVRERRLQTRTLTRDVFGTAAATISFFLPRDEDRRKNSKNRKIRDTARRIQAIAQHS